MFLIQLLGIVIHMNRLLALEKIVELGSFTKAAKSLGYTQSAISQMITSLESEQGFQLVTRSRNGAHLTAEGAQLYPLIEQTLRQYQAMQAKADSIRGLDGGVIRIGTISSVTRHWLPKLIVEFEQQYPNVQFIFHQGDYTSIPTMIRNGEVDFGIVTPPAVPDLQTVVVRPERMLAVLNPNHPYANADVVPLTALAADPYIMVEQGDYSEPLNAFHSVGVTPNLKFKIHDDYAIMTMIEAGLGFSIMSDLILSRMPFAINSLPTEPAITMTLALGYKDKDSLPIASQRFIDLLLARRDTLA